MICHLAVFHPPDLLQIRVLTDNPEDPDWAWLKWLAACSAPDRHRCRRPHPAGVHPPDGLSDLTARGPHTADAAPSGPYVVVIDLTGGKAGFPVDGRAGVTVITLGTTAVRPTGSGSTPTAAPTTGCPTRRSAW